MTTENIAATRLDTAPARAGFSLRDVIFALVFVLLPYAAMTGILLLGR